MFKHYFLALQIKSKRNHRDRKKLFHVNTDSPNEEKKMVLWRYEDKLQILTLTLVNSAVSQGLSVLYLDGQENLK